MNLLPIREKQAEEEIIGLLRRTIKREKEEAQKGVANALIFALSVTDDEDGNLVVSKEDRVVLSDQFNEKE